MSRTVDVRDSRQKYKTVAESFYWETDSVSTQVS